MKRYIKSSSTIDDEYNLSQYFPKKILQYVKEFDMQPDFDNRSGRTVHRYYAYLTNGDSVSDIGLSSFITTVRNKIQFDLQRGTL